MIALFDIYLELLRQQYPWADDERLRPAAWMFYEFDADGVEWSPAQRRRHELLLLLMVGPPPGL